MVQRYRGRQEVQPVRAPTFRANRPPALSGPLIARFVEEDDSGYVVGDPWGSQTARVPKRRAYAEPSSPERRQRRSSERLLHWSSYALIGVICGGIVGIALGGIVILAALIRLARLSQRIHRWQRRQQAEGEQDALPVEATRERMQVLAALGQSLLAILLGSAVVYVILVLR